MRARSEETLPDPSRRPPILAGGGVLWRRTAGDGVEVAVVHRPKYDDWSLPKGKKDDTDADLRACAVREVEEETGYEVEVGAVVGEARYRSTAGGGEVADKVVRYWLLKAVAGDFVPNREVDELRWLAPERALGLLSYEHERVVLERARNRLPHGP